MTLPFPIRVLSVKRTGDTAVDVEHPLMGRGVEFPSGTVAMEWYREAFPEEDRLDNEHQSIYGSIEDVEQATGGQVQVDYISTYDG